MKLTFNNSSRLIGGTTVAATALLLAAGAVSAANPPLTQPFNPACNGAYAPGQLGTLSKTLSVTGEGAAKTVTFTITYPADSTARNGRLIDCISIGPDQSGLIASVEDPSDLTSGTFTGSYTVGPAGSGADIIVNEGDIVCDVAFLTGNDGGDGGPSGQKTPEAVCTGVIVPVTTTTTIQETTTTIPATTTTIPATTTTIPATTTTIPETTSTVAQLPPVPIATTTTLAGAVAQLPPAPAAPVGDLPVTGQTSLPTVLLSLGLLAGGIAAILAARRRPA